MIDKAEVTLWGTRIGALTWSREHGVVAFRYDPAFTRSGIEVAPIRMPLADRTYVFPTISQRTFQGLPGLLVDTLPDTYGNKVINAWLASQGRDPDSFSVIERLCYTGERGMGALCFRPTTNSDMSESVPLDVGELSSFANDVLNDRAKFKENVNDHGHIRDAIRVGTSGAGGARAKALIALNKQTGEVRSGQVKAPEGFGYYLIKFDGMTNNKDRDGADPEDMTVVEYVYHLMAKEAGITMSPCELFKHNGHRHFLTKRFDRKDNGEKIHYQSWCGIDHVDRDSVGSYSYEQLVLCARKLGLESDLDQLYRRVVFNIVNRNQDDHAKNFGFLMDKRGRWSMAPAFDITFSYDPSGRWTRTHQLSLNGKTEGHTIDDLTVFASLCDIKKREALEIIEDIENASRCFPHLAHDLGVNQPLIRHITGLQRGFLTSSRP